ncbi:phosphonate metabolism protein/1,5-bisphosphokinase (PRPP-forming) PhnN [Paroceanicella profunda]|uniref:Ribose 1,5-bisphosphate phosphokinase PhnN n=1 Tax=Paroceanicella profunda TaxID=2579971 RepID=A0A5B8FZ41_9RHOB|nr:phosphonate metabolism protein/1,5-bisphosphokinase (PRPP-forming) PhnN [Paroceanicella profunda]QDL91872.1 phosphonate metabolism protein/1,5-bisphosphokinase (PRPP-forming) PhnN [Paroceanicella profunda]
MNPGTLIVVVGPSGAGKDTLIDAARAARPDIFFPRRVITRPEEAGGEAFTGVSAPEFAAREAAGGFATLWHAHGLAYGIPCEIAPVLASGRHVLFNGSRSVIGALRATHSGLRVIVVTAAPEVLAERLAARGREDAADIRARLARAGFATPEGPDVTVIDNGQPLDAAVAAFLAALPGPSAASASAPAAPASMPRKEPSRA